MATGETNVGVKHVATVQNIIFIRVLSCGFKLIQYLMGAVVSSALECEINIEKKVFTAALDSRSGPTSPQDKCGFI